MCIACNQLRFGRSLSEIVSQTTDAETPLPGASGVGDSLYPGFGNGGYDTQKYTLDLNVTDVDTGNLEAIATIEATATQDLSSFNLDFIGFTIESITVNGEAATFSRDGQELTITPAEALAADANFTVEVTYSGSPEPINSVAFTFDVPTGWVLFDGGNFVLSEPDGAANFYPVNDHPIDKAAYTFRITVPEGYEVAANGVLEETTDNGDTTTFLFEARDPMVSYLTTVNIYSNFDIQTEVSDNGITIRNYFAEGISEELLEPFALQADMIEYFSEIFGPYPFELYGSLVVNAETGSALETQTLSIFGVDMLGSESTEETIAHELAHQWFGDSVALTDWQDIWLNESFATYAQGLWVEQSKGGTEALNAWVIDQYNYIAERFDRLSTPGAPPADQLFNAAVYEWGALGLHALRLEIGDTDFFETLETYHTRFKGGNVTPEDFLGVAEEISGEELDDLFERWFYSEDLASIPELNLYAGTLGDDQILGTAAAETLSGLSGNDKVFGKSGEDALFGNAGDDKLFGRGKSDRLVGGNGSDTLHGDAGDDALSGGAGDDLLYGGTETDNISGGAGNDTVYNAGGRDLVDTGAGLDVVRLAQKAATVVLSVGDGYDTIKGFKLGKAKLKVTNIEALSFADSATGVQILQGEDVLAVVNQKTADFFSSNTSQIFVV